MDCMQAREMLDAFLTGELSAVELEELRRHLDSCEECRQELEETKRLTTTMMELLGPLKPRESFPQKVSERIVKAPGLRKLGGWVALGAAGVVALAASIALLAGEEPAGRLGVCMGEAQLFRYSSGEWKKLPLRPEVYAGEMLVTPPGARATVHLPGATVRLAENGVVQLLTGELNLTMGQLYVDARTEEGAKVRTGSALARGKQARFEVEVRQDGRVRVSAYEGKVEVKSGPGTFRVRQGRAAVFVPGKLPEKEEELKGRLPSWLDDATLEEKMRRAGVLVARLKGKEVHRAYGEILDLGGAALPALLGAAKAPDDASTPHVLRALGKLGGPRVEPVVREKLLSDDEHVFRAACEALADTGHTGHTGQKRTPDDLGDVLTDRQRPAAIRAEAARWLGRMRAKRETPRLLVSLACGEPLVEIAAAEALAKIGNKAGGFALANMLSDEREEVRKLAHRSLVRAYGVSLPPDGSAWCEWLNQR